MAERRISVNEVE